LGNNDGIYCIELNADGLSIKSGATLKKIAGNSYSAPIVHKRGSYYYLILSRGSTFYT
jgi:arabinan endo-1,5-alpha-L-arabinosidase